MTIAIDDERHTSKKSLLFTNFVLLYGLYNIWYLAHSCYISTINGVKVSDCKLNYYPEILANKFAVGWQLWMVLVIFFTVVLLIIWNLVIRFHRNFFRKMRSAGGFNYFKEQVKPHYLVLYLAIMYTILFFSGFDKFMPFFRQFNEFAGFMWFHGMILSFYTLEWKKQQFYDENTENNLDRSYELIKFD